MAHDFQLSPGPALSMRDTLSDRVTAELHRLILTGVLPAGSALPIQGLAKRFDTSAMPVREALRRLGALGLVDIAAHRGARVRDLTLADLEDSYRVRLTLEPLAVALAAENFDSESTQRARTALAQHEASLAHGDVEAARLAHTDFHFTLYNASRSRWLVRAIDPVWQNSERYRFSGPSGDSDPEQSHAEHLGILEATAARDPERARRAMREHLEGAMDRMREVLVHA